MANRKRNWFLMEETDPPSFMMKVTGCKKKTFIMIIVFVCFASYLIPVYSLGESELERILQQEFDGSYSYEYEAEIMDLIGFDRRGRDIHFDSIDYKVTPGHDLSDIYMTIYSLPDDVFQTVFLNDTKKNAGFDLGSIDKYDRALEELGIEKNDSIITGVLFNSYYAVSKDVLYMTINTYWYASYNDSSKTYKVFLGTGIPEIIPILRNRNQSIED